MDRDFEKRWGRIQQQLQAQMHGDESPRLSSRRTLFGIQSEVKRKMEEFAAQIEAENAAKRKAAREAATGGEPNDDIGADD